MDHLDLDTIIAQITSSPNTRILNDFLKNIQPDTREVILASTLSSGQDPLNILDLRANSLGVLYILSARISVHGAVPPPWQVVDNFCQNFDQNQVRYAPERVILLGKNLSRLAAHYNNQIAAILPLRSLIQRFVPDPSCLTALHPQFLLLCVSSRRFADALPILTHPITSIDSTDMHYTDNLVYHYTGGIALAALKRWSAAEEFFDICVTAPGLVASAIQLEALKKMRLVQLIAKGKTEPLPKYALPNLTRLFKNTPYNTFANAYPSDVGTLRDIVKKDRQVFVTDKNVGLINQAIDRAPRWALKRLIGTYVTLNLTDIARQVKIDSVDHVREMLLNMIESNEISAQISANGTVTFSDPPPTITKTQVDALLRQVQVQSSLLTKLDLDVGKSREFLAKAVKLREDFGGGGGNTAEDFLLGSSMGAVVGGSGGEGGGVWVEEAGFTS
ncbi:hypothetical protein P691DRAFT_806121 [Macrolepiota fuliginosa MF-IS2]|uniref:COP9 signalosome complex subunit 3 n=1 Tax=Macrolepiota fuliginosa MF-IS2 TaxID=1400762 RepID=A0A9P5X5X0_9AGAR|nr:hypothetical protein P691DRAFT_806121 [Macrolepiota fuliginosa MF-IS2]